MDAATATATVAVRERPFIVRFENQKSTSEFDVVIHHQDCVEATHWARGYFGSRIQYLYSDFDGNHTYRRSGSDGGFM